MYRRGGCEDLGNVLHHCGSCGTTLQVRDVGHVPADWEDAGKFSPSGDTAADGADDTVEQEWDMGSPYPVGGNVRGGYVGYGDLCFPPSENRRAIYHNKANNGPVSGGVATPRGTCFEAVVGTGATQYGGDIVGGPGGGGRQGLGGVVRI